MLRLVCSTIVCVAVIGSPCLADGIAVGSLKDELPVVAPVAIWTGCYFGGDTGYKFGRSRTDIPTPYRAGPSLLTAANETVRPNGTILGGQVGCHQQVSPLLVLGLEASATKDWGRDTVTSDVFRPGGKVGSVDTDIERSCQVRIGPKIGTVLTGLFQATGDGLSPHVYATAGYAGSCVRTSQNGTIAGTAVSASTKDFQNGVFFGAGADIPTAMIFPNTFVQIEYSHTDYRSSQFGLAGSTESGRLTSSTDEVRFGFKYRFGKP